MNRPALVTLSLARLAIVTVTGAIVAVAVAVAASPLMPIGPARFAEPSPGIEVNLAILGAGFAAIALLPLAVLVPPAWRAARQAHGPLGVAEPAIRQSRPSRLAAALTRAGSVTGGAGVAMAFEPGHGRTAVPVRSALAGSVIAVAALAAATVFGASLVGLVSTPHDYGQNWQQEVDFGFGTASATQAAQVPEVMPAVSGYAAGNYGQLTIDRPDRARDRPRPGARRRLPHAAGRPRARWGGRDRPRRADARRDRRAPRAERQRHRQPGHHRRPWSQASHEDRRRRRPARVQPGRLRPHRPGHRRGAASRRAVQLGGVPEPDGDAGLHDQRDLLQLLPAQIQARRRPRRRAPPGSRAALRQSGCPVGSCIVAPVADQRPGDIKNYASIRDTPLVLAAVLAVLAIGTLAHVLLTGVRRRRRDLALLKTLGFTRPQILGMVAWEASAFAAVALLSRTAPGRPRRPLAWAFFANAAGVSAGGHDPAHHCAARRSCYAAGREPHRRLPRLGGRPAAPRARPANGVNTAHGNRLASSCAPTCGGAGGRCSASPCCSASSAAWC